MITEAIVSVFAAVASWLPTLFPVVAVPAFVSGIPDSVANLGDYTSGLDPWVPLPIVVTALGVWAACILAAVVIKIVRIVASFLSLGGGSAA